MATHIDASYVGVYIGEDARDELSGSVANLTTMITDASAMVDSALTNAGYSPDDIDSSDVPSLIKQATLGQVIRMLYRRKGLDVPTEFSELTSFLDAIYDGRLPIPELTPDASEAVGGTQFTNSSETADEGRPCIFANGKLRNYY